MHGMYSAEYNIMIFIYIYLLPSEADICYWIEVWLGVYISD